MNTVQLRKLVEEDAERLAELANNESVWSNLRDKMPHPYSLEDAKQFIASSTKENNAINFGIDYKNELCGVIGIITQNDVYRFSAEIGYWLGEPFWGKGITTKALQLITNYAFDTLNLNRVFAASYGFNKASIRVLEKNGFKHEGILKEAVFKNGKFHDEWRFGKLKE